MTSQPRIPALPGTYETIHGPVEDPYFGLRYLTGDALEQVLASEDAHLEAERDQWAGHAARLYAAARERLADQTSISYPTRMHDFLSFSILPAGADHPVLYTAPLFADAQAISDGDLSAALPLLDISELAARSGQSGYALGDWDTHADGSNLIYTDCADGSESYTLRDSSGAALGPTRIGPAVAYWDASRVLYTELDDAMRPWRVLLHDLATGEAIEVGSCPDPELYYSFSLDPEARWLTLISSGHSASSCQLLTEQDGRFALVAQTGLRDGVHATARARGDMALFLYSFDDGRSELRDARTGSLLACGDGEATDIVSAGTDGRRVRITVREGLSTGLVIMDGDEQYRIFSEAGSIGMYDMQPGSPFALVSEDRWHAPSRILRVDLATGVRTEVACQPVAAFDADDYTSRTLWITARDGVQVPVTLIHRTDQQFPAPAVVYAYGAYGIPLTPGFSATRAGLLDAGAVLAIAHVRGGGDLGRTWHEAGRKGTKLNTFHDLIDVVATLQDRSLVSRAVIDGGSAGGATVSHAANLAPDLFAGVIAEVPFVDAVATMCDASLPLTVGEYAEWGDPNTPEGLAWIRSWSPVDNIVSGQVYPPFYAVAGVNDPRVGFWEALKLAAWLRSAHASNRVTVRADRGAGHSGASGRWEHIAQMSDAWAFALHALGVPALPSASPARTGAGV